MFSDLKLELVPVFLAAFLFVWLQILRGAVLIGATEPPPPATNSCAILLNMVLLVMALLEKKAWPSTLSLLQTERPKHQIASILLSYLITLPGLGE